jgi:hypothetical protein
MKHTRPRSSTVRAATVAAFAAAALIAVAPPAQARNVRLMESVSGAVRAPRVHDLLGNLGLRFGSDTGRSTEVVRRDVAVTGSGTTKLDDVGEDDKVRPSDHDLCARAFEDAITKLVFAARQSRATAIVGVVSTYEGKVFDDPGHFECHAGAIKAHVSLRAQLVRGPVDVPVPPLPVPLPPASVGDAPPPPTFQPLPPAPAPAPN